MGNVCTCCQWGRGAPGAANSKSTKKDAWFDQDTVPLVSARHGPDDIGYDNADGSLKRMVLIRLPRSTSAATSDTSGRSSRTSRHLQQQHKQDESQSHVHRTKSTSVDGTSHGRHLSKRSEHGDDQDHSRRHSKHHHRYLRAEEDTDDRYRRARATSLEVEASTRDTSSRSVRSPQIASYSQDAASFGNDEVESVDSFHGSSRSHRSSSASSSPKASSKNGSPGKKPRYGRKHYRANANRK